MKSLLFLILFIYAYESIGQSFSTLRINLNIEGAEVFLDKVLIKEKNLFNKLTVAPGKHSITARKNGYNPYQFTFSVNSGELKTISIILEKDIRSLIEIFSNSTNTIFKLNDEIIDWNSSTPLTKLLEPGSYDFSFSEYGMVPATRTLTLDESSAYKIKVNLLSTYPFINAGEVGREIKSLYTADDFNKPTMKSIPNGRTSTVQAWVDGIVAAGIAALVTRGSENQLLWSGGALVVGFYITYFTGSIKYKNVPDNENIEYNNNVVPSIVLEKNLEIEQYNNETQRLIEEKQKEKYIESSITIETINSGK